MPEIIRRFLSVKWIVFILLFTLPVIVWVVNSQPQDVRSRATSIIGDPTNSIRWETPEIAISANQFHIQIGDAWFGEFIEDMTVTSANNSNATYTTLEMSWQEAPIQSVGGDMKLIIKFFSDGDRWWSEEIQTYNTADPRTLISYRPNGGRFFDKPMGVPFTGDFTATSEDGTGTIVLEGITELIAFKNQPVRSCEGAAEGISCIASECGCTAPPGAACLTVCRDVPGSCNAGVCTVIPPGVIGDPPTTPATQTIKFEVKFAGVTDNKANGAKAIAHIYRPPDDQINTLVSVTTQPITFQHKADGVYAGSVTLTDPLPAGDGYVIFIKGEKHLKRKFCKGSGQTTTCAIGERSIVIPSAAEIPTFDFTGLLLEPGDVSTQDGKADRSDFEKITGRLKLCAEQTDADKLIGDLDYSGCINTRDILLMRQSLETRYDEN